MRFFNAAGDLLLDTDTTAVSELKRAELPMGEAEPISADYRDTCGFFKRVLEPLLRARNAIASW